MKKLKFWSNKKRKKKYFYDYQKLPQCNFEPYAYQPPTPTASSPPPSRLPPPRPQPLELCQCHFCQPVEPSAPPLPPWLEPTSDWTRPPVNSINSEDEGDNHFISISQEIVIKASTVYSNTDTSNHLIENSDIVANDIREETLSDTTQQFGCVVKLGGLLRCLFPCFHISDHSSNRPSISYKRD